MTILDVIGPEAAQQEQQLFRPDQFVNPGRQVGCIEEVEEGDLAKFFIREERNELLNDVFSSFDDKLGAGDSVSLTGLFGKHLVKLARETDPGTGDVTRSFVFLNWLDGRLDSVRRESALSVIETPASGIFAEFHRDDFRGKRDFVFGQHPLDMADFLIFEHARNVKPLARLPLHTLIDRAA